MTAQSQGRSAAPTPLAYFATQTFKAFNTNKTSWIGLLFFVIVVVLAIAAPVLSPFDPNDQNIMEKLRPPSVEHWLGTDSFGRDTLSRLLYGARVSLVIGVVSTLAAMVIGSAIPSTMAPRPDPSTIATRGARPLARSRMTDTASPGGVLARSRWSGPNAIGSSSPRVTLARIRSGSRFRDRMDIC